MSTKTILCFGDSNTWGYDCDIDPNNPSRRTYEKRWTTLLEIALNNSKTSTFIVISEGLNGRTTIFPDDKMSAYADSNLCVGKSYLLPCLHSHKPIDVIIIALGTNDLKQHLKQTPETIADGVCELVQDVLDAEMLSIGVDKTLGPDVSSDGPKILVLGPPELCETTKNLDWGFKDCAERSRELSKILEKKVAAKVLKIKESGTI